MRLWMIVDEQRIVRYDLQRLIVNRALAPRELNLCSVLAARNHGILAVRARCVAALGGVRDHGTLVDLFIHRRLPRWPEIRARRTEARALTGRS